MPVISRNEMEKPRLKCWIQVTLGLNPTWLMRTAVYNAQKLKENPKTRKGWDSWWSLLKPAHAEFLAAIGLPSFQKALTSKNQPVTSHYSATVVAKLVRPRALGSLLLFRWRFTLWVSQAPCLSWSQVSSPPQLQHPVIKNHPFGPPGAGILKFKSGVNDVCSMFTEPPCTAASPEHSQLSQLISEVIFQQDKESQASKQVGSSSARLNVAWCRWRGWIPSKHCSTKPGCCECDGPRRS